MSSYPPPPDDQQPYNALYSPSAGASQLLDPVQQAQLQFTNLNQQLYPAKTEAAARQYSPSSQTLVHELQDHANLDEQRRQDAQLISQQAPSPHQLDADPTSQMQLQQREAAPPAKSNRLRKACDSCSIRKVKCDESGPPCRACAVLDIPCTFDRPSRRRGPPNRHAEAIKRRRIDDDGNPTSPNLSGTPKSTPSSPTQAAQALAALALAPMSAETICALDALDSLIDDFFVFIYPLHPFPHEPSFRGAWMRREDISDRSFLALLAAMIAATVASSPLRCRPGLSAPWGEDLIANQASFVHHCQKVCSAARGPGYLGSNRLTVQNAATSYFLALTGIYTSQWPQARVYFGECCTILRTIALDGSNVQSMPQRPVGDSYENGADESASHGFDNISLEIGRRIFWTTFLTAKRMEQTGADLEDLLIPPTRSKPYPPLPAQVDDFCIYPTRTQPQPEGLLPLMTGFNLSVLIHTSYNNMSSLDIAWGSGEETNQKREKRIVHEALRRCKSVLDQLPHELSFLPIPPPFGDLAQTHSNGYLPRFVLPQFLRNSASHLAATSHSQTVEIDPEERRHNQYETQKATICASMLATRLHIVQRYWSMSETSSTGVPQHPDLVIGNLDAGAASADPDQVDSRAAIDEFNTIEKEMSEERDNIVRDLLMILANINPVNSEPGAESFVTRVLSIARALLQQPDQQKGEFALLSQDQITGFVQILAQLEHDKSASDNTDRPDDPATEQRVWEELREYQTKFA